MLSKIIAKPPTRIIFRKATVLFVIFFTYAAVWGQNEDAIKITEAKIAIEKYQDFQAALKSLKEVSAKGQSDPLYIYYSAVANEKMGNLEDAVMYYNKYLKLFPNKIEIIEKIAELNYKIKNINDLSGLWKNSSISGVRYKLEQNGNEIKITFETITSDLEHRSVGEIRFTGTRMSNLIKGKMSLLFTGANECQGTWFKEDCDCVGEISADGKTIVFTYDDRGIKENYNGTKCYTYILGTKEKVTYTKL